MKKVLVLTLLLGLVLTACAAAQLGGNFITLPQKSGTAVPETPTETSFPASTVLEYTRSGGLQGKTESWSINTDGKVTGPNGQVSSLDPARLAQLVSDFTAVDLAAFTPDSSTSPVVCNDCYTYQVTVRSGGEVKIFTVVDAQPGVPENFWAALQNLQQALAPQ